MPLDAARDGRTFLSLHFGALVPKVAEQLAEDGLTADPSNITCWQKDADAITRLIVRGLLTESQAHQARGKLVRSIAANVRAAEGK